MSEIVLAKSPNSVYRVSFTENSLALTPREIVQEKPLNRFDDPKQEYRVLYASTSRPGAMVETLQDLRPSLAALNALQRVMQNDIGYAVSEPKRSSVSDPWILQRYSGKIVSERPLKLVDLSNQRTITALREPLADVALRRGMTDISAASFMGSDRQFTTAASRVLFEMAERYDGVYFQSALGAPYTNVGFFEDLQSDGGLRAPLALDESSRQIGRDDPDLRDALERLDLTLSDDGIELSKGSERAIDDYHEFAR